MKLRNQPFPVLEGWAHTHTHQLAQRLGATLYRGGRLGQQSLSELTSELDAALQVGWAMVGWGKNVHLNLHTRSIQRGRHTSDRLVQRFSCQ